MSTKNLAIRKDPPTARRHPVGGGASASAKKKAVRKGPTESAAQFAVGAKRLGNNGRRWIVVETVTGVRRWRPVLVAARKGSAALALKKIVAKQRSNIAATDSERRRCWAHTGKLTKGRILRKIEVFRRSSGWQRNRPGYKAEIWIHISPGYIYLSYRPGRSYWLLCNIAPTARPRITFQEEAQIMAINTYRVRFARRADYNYAQESLADFTS